MFKVKRVDVALQIFKGDKVILTERRLVTEQGPVFAGLSCAVDKSISFTPVAKSNIHDKLILQNAFDSLSIASTIKPAVIEEAFIDESSLSPEDDLSKLGAVIQEIREGSITPNTFVSREFKNSIDDWYYKDIYQYRDNVVTRFGFNVLALSDTLSLDQINIEPLEPSDSVSETSSNQSVSRKSHSSNGKKPVVLPKYYTLEIELLGKAITFLLDNESCKTVVVDILAQEAGELKIDQTSRKIETHAVLLYKNPIALSSLSAKDAEIKVGALKDDKLSTNEASIHEIIVIDPSNSAYSAHLANLTSKHITHPSFEKISTTKKSIQIYTTPTGMKTGHEFNQYRDCVDVAIKLGFGFNEADTGLVINSKNFAEFKSLEVIQKVTNQPKLDDNIIDQTLINRVKQTSDVKIVEAFNKLEMVIKYKLDEVIKRFPAEYDVIYDLHHEILASNNTSKIILDELLVCNKACVDIFVAEHCGLVELLRAIDAPVELGGVS